jgi:pimeloyl-ACP methyl ester carboxylesterase
LPILRFAIEPASAERLTASYSFRLQRNLEPHRDYLGDIRRMPGPGILLVGAEDEIFKAAFFAPLLEPEQPLLKVEVIPGLGHIAMTTDPRGTAAVRQAFEGLR